MKMDEQKSSLIISHVYCRVTGRWFQFEKSDCAFKVLLPPSCSLSRSVERSIEVPHLVGMILVPVASNLSAINQVFHITI